MIKDAAERSEQSQVIVRKLRNVFPLLATLDFAGLICAIFLVILRLGVELQIPSHRVFLVLLFASGINAWLLISQFKSLETVLRKHRVIMLLAPSLAALSTLVIQALARSYYSGTALVMFVFTWTLWLFIVRLTSRRYLPPLKVLTIGSPSFSKEMANLPRVQLSRLDSPPNRFEGWDIVAVDPAETYSNEWLQWLAHADMYGIKTLSAPIALETLTRRVPLEMLHGRWAIEILHGQTNYMVWKRFFDLAVVLLMSPFILLLSGVVAVVVYFDVGKPVLFWQERVGKNGKLFKMVKFRSMRTDAEANGSAFASKDDPRITATGRFLRKFRLDELPQFWNVWRGEMSIIGPRPEQKAFADLFEKEIPLYGLRHNVPPGITGWAQVMSGYAADADETRTKLRYDFYYVKHCSLELDLRIVYQTIFTILTGFGSR